MRRWTTWTMAVGLVLWSACQGAPPAPRPAAGKDPGVLAAEALASGQYARAAELYRQAIAATPDSVPLRYGLGVAASHVGRRDEAVRELVWVLQHGDPESTEVKAAQGWLASVGALPKARVAAAVPTEEPATTPGAGRVAGRVVSTDDGSTPMQRMQLLLMEHPSKENYFRLRTDEQGRYSFANVPPGTYKLTDVVAGPPKWRLRVVVKAGDDSTVDLGPGNSAKVRDDFPEGPQN